MLGESLERPILIKLNETEVCIMYWNFNILKCSLEELFMCGDFNKVNCRFFEGKGIILWIGVNKQIKIFLATRTALALDPVIFNWYIFF